MNKINENDKMNFLYDLKSKENMHLYYAFKGRFDYTIEDKDQKMKLIQDSIYVPLKMKRETVHTKLTVLYEVDNERQRELLISKGKETSSFRAK